MENLHGLNDAELVELFNDCHDKAAFETIYLRYWPKVFAFAYPLVRDKDAAMDIVQNIFVDLWERRGEFTQASRMEAYLYKSVKNQIANAIRRQSVRKKHQESVRQFYDSGAIWENDEARQNELHGLIHNAVEKLPANIREAFLAYCAAEGRQQDIAERLHITPKTLRDRKDKAVAKLRELLGDLFFSILFSWLWLFVMYTVFEQNNFYMLLPFLTTGGIIQ